MKPNEYREAERAELIQSVKALLIPLSLFLACVIMAAGTFLIFNGEPVGWAFAGVSAMIVVSSFVALIRFQNKYRARGIIRSNSEGDDDLLVFDPETFGGTAPKPRAASEKVSVR